MSLNVHVIECDIDPNITPTAVGQHWVNTSSGDLWFSKGTSSVADWVKLDGDTNTFTTIQEDGSTISTNAPTLDFDGSDFTIVESPADDFDIKVKDSGIDHNQTTNYVAAEHIDWTQSGAGTIHASNYVDNNDDEKAKVSSNDTTPGYLFDKIQAGSNVTIVENNNGGNETMTISATGALTQNCPAVQARRTTDYTLTTSYVDITFDLTDVENFPGTVEHDNTNTDRILIKETGLYLVHYHLQSEITSSSRFDYRVRKNDSVVLNGSETYRLDGSDTLPSGATFLVELAANDFLSLQVKRDGGAGSLLGNTVLSVHKCAGAKGDTGATGSGSTVTIADEGSNIANTPHSRLNFVGSGVTATDGGAGTTTITIPGSTTPVFGSQYQHEESIGLSGTTSSTFQTKLTLTTPSVPAGVYRIGWAYDINATSSSTDAEARVFLNGATQVDISTIFGTEGYYNQLHNWAGFAEVTLSSGVQTILLQYRRSAGGGSSQAQISKARLEIWRVG